MPDIIRIEANERTIRDWVHALRLVREELFAEARRRIGSEETEARYHHLLRAYSGLAHLTDVLREAIGEGRD